MYICRSERGAFICATGEGIGRLEALGGKSCPNQNLAGNPGTAAECHTGVAKRQWDQAMVISSNKTAAAMLPIQQAIE